MIAWLARTGIPGVSRHTVDRLMRQEGMRGLVRGREARTTIPAREGRARDLLSRQFRTTAPNRACVTDFTYVPTWSGLTYVALVTDLYPRVIVGWSASTAKDVALRRVVPGDGAVAARPQRTAGASRHDPSQRCRLAQYTSMRFSETPRPRRAVGIDRHRRGRLR
jgi:transposase InsO family protein